MISVLENCNKTDSLNKVLWLVQVILACGIVIWRINPVSRDIKQQLFLIVGWIAVSFLLYGCNFFSLLINRRSIFYMLTWPAILLLYSIVGHSAFSMSYILDLVCMHIGLFYLIAKDYKASIIVIVVSAIYISIICVNTQIAYSVNPALSRILSHHDKIEIPYYKLYLTPYIAGYDAIYGLVFIITAIGIYLNCLRKYRIFLFIVFLLCFSTVLKAQFFIAICLVLFSFVAIFEIIDTTNEEKILKGLVIMISLLFTLFFSPILLNYVADNFDLSDNITFRLKDLADAFSGNALSSDSDVASRNYFYNISINNFLDHMMFGCGNIDNVHTGYGNHSTFLDSFAKYGIVGGSAFIMFHLGPLNAITSVLASREKNGMRIIMAVLLVLSVINVANTRINYALIYIVIPLFFNIMSKERLA